MVFQARGVGKSRLGENETLLTFSFLFFSFCASLPFLFVLLSSSLFTRVAVRWRSCGGSVAVVWLFSGGNGAVIWHCKYIAFLRYLGFFSVGTNICVSAKSPHHGTIKSRIRRSQTTNKVKISHLSLTTISLSLNRVLKQHPLRVFSIMAVLWRSCGGHVAAMRRFCENNNAIIIKHVGSLQEVHFTNESVLFWHL